MSEKTKRQALGYIAKALFMGGIPHRDLKEIMSKANRSIKKDEVMDDNSVSDLFLSLCHAASIKKKQFDECLGFLHWSFYHHTVERAEEMFDAYVLISGYDSLRDRI